MSGVSSSDLASAALLQACQCLKFRPIKMNSSRKFGSPAWSEGATPELERRLRNLFNQLF